MKAAINISLCILTTLLLTACATQKTNHPPEILISELTSCITKHKDQLPANTQVKFEINGGDALIKSIQNIPSKNGTQRVWMDYGPKELKACLSKAATSCPTCNYTLHKKIGPEENKLKKMFTPNLGNMNSFILSLAAKSLIQTISTKCSKKNNVAVVMMGSDEDAKLMDFVLTSSSKSIKDKKVQSCIESRFASSSSDLLDVNFFYHLQ